MPFDVSHQLPLVIEFVGVPGAGKSTLVRETVRILRSRGIEAGTMIDHARGHVARTSLGRVVSKVKPQRFRDACMWQLFLLLAARDALGFARERASLSRSVMRMQRGRPISLPMKRHILFWFFHLGGRHRLLSRLSARGEALVVDDGFLHRAVHLTSSHVDRPDPEWIRNYVGWVPQPDLVVHVVAGSPTCSGRVTARGLWAHSRRLSSDDLDRYIDAAAVATKVAVARARELNWEVVDVENEGRDLSEVTDDLSLAIEAFLRRVSSRRILEQDVVA
ncbi:MAG: hypothetical protein M3516_01790 [Actinomycetota bacterium]|nr:hypothetical protein [Actinomycetota bacterium]